MGKMTTQHSRFRFAGVGLAALMAAGLALTISGVANADPIAPSVAATPVTPSASTADIKLAQTDLNGLNYNVGGVDGVVGPVTTGQTEYFQSDRCIGVDGAIGPQTLASLESEVKQVQSKAGVAQNGIYSASTTSAVKSYQSGHGLTADGIAGSATMKSMGITRVGSCNNGTAQGEKIVDTAKSQLGVTANSSECVPGKPYSICADWCAAFATWVWRDAGESIPSMTYVPNVYDWAVSNNRWYGTSQLSLAKPGDLIIFGSANNRYHIGVVDHVSGGTVYVISGNTENPNASGQWGVFDKPYALSGSLFYGLVHL
jgi:hypothetical protein